MPVPLSSIVTRSCFGSCCNRTETNVPLLCVIALSNRFLSMRINSTRSVQTEVCDVSKDNFILRSSALAVYSLMSVSVSLSIGKSVASTVTIPASSFDKSSTLDSRWFSAVLDWWAIVAGSGDKTVFCFTFQLTTA